MEKRNVEYHYQLKLDSLQAKTAPKWKKHGRRSLMSQSTTTTTLTIILWQIDTAQHHSRMVIEKPVPNIAECEYISQWQIIQKAVGACKFKSSTDSKNCFSKNWKPWLVCDQQVLQPSCRRPAYPAKTGNYVTLQPIKRDKIWEERRTRG